MESKKVREAFINYFKSHGHTVVASSALIPEGDDTLLFANAGMNQFKNVFTGLEKRDYVRAVSSQKCVRAGGKHNDLENVGHTARHHTFFEMLGNFSFGDYFKKDAIKFAWDFLTNQLKIDHHRLYVTVHISDDEAAQIWEKQEGVPANRIFRFDQDNFWRMGDVGPCGPCSEIFFDHAPDGKVPTQNEFAAQSDRFVEIWNLVFMQFNEDGSGRHPLPKPSVDTGSGLERLTAVMQGRSNNYDTDLFAGLIEGACAEITPGDRLTTARYGDLASKKNLSAHEKNQLVALRVLADHARATSFLIADGVLPSNEGRGYVLRRIMRRAIRYGRTIATSGNTFAHFCKHTIQAMSDIYPELKKRESVILKNVEDEIERFLKTLDQGTEILNGELTKLRQQKSTAVSGETAFRLYDTFGFPLDLTCLMAKEAGFTVDEAGFNHSMSSAKNLARASWKGQALSHDEAHLVTLSQRAKASEFTGYTATNDNGKILLLSSGHEEIPSLSKGSTGLIVTDRTCFYAEGGGQVGDRGMISTPTGKARINDCTKTGNIFFHHVEVIEGKIELAQSAQLIVDSSERRLTAANHSATHLLHSALREVLGPHVTQAGSQVNSQRLRFDFTHGKALSTKELTKIEDWVNREISMGQGAQALITDMRTAVEKEGALALFGEKYGDQVRVIKMGPHSTELCGGTHVENTAMIRLFKIVTEAGVSAGIRRIEALTSNRALDFLNCHAEENSSARNASGIQSAWDQIFVSDHATAAEFIEKQKQEIRSLQKELRTLKGGQVDLNQLISDAAEFSLGTTKGRLITAQLPIDDRDVLNSTAERLRDKVESGVIVLLGHGDGSHPMIIAVSKNLTGQVKAGDILREVAAALGGKGGGRPDFAQGSVQDLSNLSAAFAKARAALGITH